MYNLPLLLGTLWRRSSEHWAFDCFSQLEMVPMCTLVSVHEIGLQVHLCAFFKKNILGCYIRLAVRAIIAIEYVKKNRPRTIVRNSKKRAIRFYSDMF